MKPEEYVKVTCPYCGMNGAFDITPLSYGAADRRFVCGDRVDEDKWGPKILFGCGKSWTVPFMGKEKP